MRRYKLTENRLRDIIRETVNEYLVESQNSGSHFAKQIDGIVKQILDRIGKRNFKSFYTHIAMPLDSFSIRQSYVDEYSIYVEFVEGEDEVGGSLNVNNEAPIHIEIPIDGMVNYQEIYNVIEHEVTHLADYLIQVKTGYKDYYYNYFHMTKFDVPHFAALIMYMLWSDTELKAYNSASDDDKSMYFDALMNNLTEAYNNNNEEDWMRIQEYITKRSNIGKENLEQYRNKISNMDLYQFKKYFIDTSFKKLKKMVKKNY